MKKLIVLLILALSLVNVAIPAWGAGHTNPGDVVYEDPAPPK
jgi:hypothetical protein